jgi:hypothetical protein
MKLPETPWDYQSRRTRDADAKRDAWMKEAPKAIFHSVGMDIYEPVRDQNGGSASLRSNHWA